MSGGNFRKLEPIIPRVWATLANYAGGPDIGTANKVDITDGAAAEGWIPEDELAAQHLNFELNRMQVQLRDETEKALLTLHEVFLIGVADWPITKGIIQQFNGLTIVGGRADDSGVQAGWLKIKLAGIGLTEARADAVTTNWEAMNFVAGGASTNIVQDLATAHPAPATRSRATVMVTRNTGSDLNIREVGGASIQLLNSDNNSPERVMYDNFNDRFIVTSEAGTVWTKVSNDAAWSAEISLPSNAGERIVQNAHNGLGRVVVAAATGTAGVIDPSWSSTDGGVNWVKSSTGMPPGLRLLTYDPSRSMWLAVTAAQDAGNGSRGYSELWKNTQTNPDGGWVLVCDTITHGFGSATPGAWDAFRRFEVFGSAWVVTYRGQQSASIDTTDILPGVLYSVDAGVNWKHLTGYSGNDTPFDLHHDGFNLWVVVDALDELTGGITHKFFRTRTLPTDELIFSESQL